MICTLTPETKLTYGQICTNGITAFSTCNSSRIITDCGPKFRPHDTEFLALYVLAASAGCAAYLQIAGGPLVAVRRGYTLWIKSAFGSASSRESADRVGIDLKSSGGVLTRLRPDSFDL